MVRTMIRSLFPFADIPQETLAHYRHVHSASFACGRSESGLSPTCPTPVRDTVSMTQPRTLTLLPRARCSQRANSLKWPRTPVGIATARRPVT
jgi:hypothetical protein